MCLYCWCLSLSPYMYYLGYASITSSAITWWSNEKFEGFSINLSGTHAFRITHFITILGGRAGIVAFYYIFIFRTCLCAHLLSIVFSLLFTTYKWYKAREWMEQVFCGVLGSEPNFKLFMETHISIILQGSEKGVMMIAIITHVLYWICRSYDICVV